MTKHFRSHPTFLGQSLLHRAARELALTSYLLLRAITPDHKRARGARVIYSFRPFSSTLPELPNLCPRLTNVKDRNMISSILLLAVPFTIRANAAAIPASAQAVGLDISSTLQNILANTQGSTGYTYPTDLTRGIIPVSFCPIPSFLLPPSTFHPSTMMSLANCSTSETNPFPQRLLARRPLLLSPLRRRRLRRSRRLPRQQHPPHRTRTLRPHRRPHIRRPLHPTHPRHLEPPKPLDTIRHLRDQKRRLRYLLRPNHATLRRRQNRRRNHLARRRERLATPPLRRLSNHRQRLIHHPRPHHRHRHRKHAPRPSRPRQTTRLLLRRGPTPPQRHTIKHHSLDLTCRIDGFWCADRTHQRHDIQLDATSYIEIADWVGQVKGDFGQVLGYARVAD